MKKSKLIFGILFSAMILSFSTNIFSETKDKINNEISISLTENEKEYIKNIKKIGKLKVAMRKGDIPTAAQSNNITDTFHYNLALGFAKYLGVKLEVKYVVFKDFFSKSGKDVERVKKEKNYSYTPDIFNNVDLIGGNLTINEWRKKLMNFTEIFPNREMLLIKSTKNIKNLDELNGKTFATMKLTSFEDNMKNIEKSNNIKIKYKYCNTLDESWKAVSDEKADFAVDDAINAIVRMKKFRDIKIAMPISDPEILGWGIQKENTELKSIFDKYIEAAIKNGTFNKIWLDYYGESFYEFRRIIQY